MFRCSKTNKVRNVCNRQIYNTRKHSSRMRTVRCSDRHGGEVCTCSGVAWGLPARGKGVYLSGGGGVPAQGVYLPRGIPTQGCSCRGYTYPGGCTWSGGYLPGVYPSMYWGRHPLWTEWLTDMCKNITLPQVRCGR